MIQLFFDNLLCLDTNIRSSVCLSRLQGQVQHFFYISTFKFFYNIAAGSTVDSALAFVGSNRACSPRVSLSVFVEVSQPCKLIRVMSSALSLPNHSFFTGRLSPLCGYM